MTSNEIMKVVDIRCARKKLVSIVEFSDHRLAFRAMTIMADLTGDRCCLLRTSFYWRIVRFDPSGQEVEWE